MAVVIRLARHGKKKKPFYRIVVADKKSPRDGRFLEFIGTYNTLFNPPLLELKEDRVKHWVGAGAVPSQTVASLIDKKLPGFLDDRETHKRKKIKDARKKRKTRSKGEKSAKPKAEKAAAKKTAKAAAPKKAAKAKKE